MLLLNSVLNVIPIFFMSVMKMPVLVWKKIVRIQREFLWGGVKRSKCIPCVSWSVACKPKREGGLGVRDLCQVNLALLAKWRWRYLLGEGVFGEILFLPVMVVVIVLLILEVGPPGFMGLPRSGRIFPSYGVIRRLVRTGFRSELSGCSGTVLRLNSGMILGVGRSSLNLGSVGFSSFLSSRRVELGS